jgi:hypothetical protein
MKPQKFAALFVTVLVITVLAVPLVHADTILVGAPTPTNSFYGMCCGSDISAAVQFALSSNQFVTTIGVVLSGAPGTIFDFSLQNSLASPTTIFASAVIPAPLGQNTDMVNVNATLAAGTYYLVGKEEPSSPFIASGWFLSNGTLVTNAGSVTNGIWSSAPGLPWTFDTYACGASCTAPVFTVNGPGAVVPEPSTIVLFGTGLLGIVSAVRRKLFG